MKTIVISGWNAAFLKTNCTRLLRTELGLSLKEAKDAADAILDGQAVSLEVIDSHFEPLLAKLNELGAKAEPKNDTPES